jgi:hypothetical protein
MLNTIITLVIWAGLIMMGLVLIPLLAVYMFAGLMVLAVLVFVLYLYWMGAECIHACKVLYLRLRRWYGTYRQPRT